MNQSDLKIEETTTEMNIQDKPFEVFLNDLKARMKNVFHFWAEIYQMAIKRRIPPFVVR